MFVHLAGEPSLHLAGTLLMDAGLIFRVFQSVSFLCASASIRNSENSVLELQTIVFVLFFLIILVL